MKEKILFIHGGDAYSKHEDFLRALQIQKIRNAKGEDSAWWSKRLREDLGESFEVYQPKMPNAENAHYDEWKIWFERHLELMEGRVTLIGWSLGGMFLLKYLSEESPKVEIPTLYTLAAPAGYYDDPTGNDCGSFQFPLEALPVVASKAKKVHILHSTDDFLVPYEHAERLAAALPKATLHTFEDKNHFLVEEFPELIELIKNDRG